MKVATLEYAVGAFLILGIAAVGYLAIHLGSGSSVGGGSYVIEARFANSGGLTRGGTVRLAGVQVGRVDELRLDPEDYSAIAILRVRDGVLLPTDTMASIKTSGLIGDKFVALLPGADETYLAEGDRIDLTESSVDLESLIGKMAFGSVESEPTEETQPAP